MKTGLREKLWNPYMKSYIGVGQRNWNTIIY